MSLTLTLSLILLCFVVIWFYQGRDFWRRWQRFRAWEQREALQTAVEEDANAPLISYGEEGETRSVSHSIAMPVVRRQHHEQAGGTYRADGLPTFRAAAPQAGTIFPNAGVAMAAPPRDLRISIAEMDRSYPHLRYLFPVGWSVPGAQPKLTACAFVEDVNHVLVTGFTDSGKDSLVNSWLYTLCYRYNPDQLQLAIIDGKNGLSLRGWYEKAHVWLFSRHPNELEAALLSVRQERERREKILWDARCEKWEEYDGEPIPLLIVYVSELLVLESILGKTGLGDWLNVELSACRAAGIRFIIGAQNVTRMDTRWRGQCGLLCAGYQQADSADEPNTGLTTPALRKLGTLGQQIVAVPPSELPIPPAGAGIFTCVQGRTVLTLRAPRIDRPQREWWLSHIQERPAGTLPAANQAWDLPSEETIEDIRMRPDELTRLHNGSGWTDMANHDTAAAPPVIALARQPESSVAPYNPHELAEVLRTVNVKDLPDHPVFVAACKVAYQTRESYMGVAKEFWGTSTGSREKAVKTALGHASKEATRSEFASAA